MKQILVQDKNQSIAIDSMDVAKNIFRPFLVANYVDYDDDFKPIGGGQKAHDKYIQWYKTYVGGFPCRPFKNHFLMRKKRIICRC